MKRNRLRTTFLACTLLLVLTASPQTVIGPEVPTATAMAVTDSAQVAERCLTCGSGVRYQCPIRVALKTNLLFDAVLVPNLGLEVALCNQLSISVDWMYTWFKNDSRHRYWQCYGGYLTLRRYLRPLNEHDNDLSGHHLGAYVSALTYDVEWGGKGYQSNDFGYGFGLEYGYSVFLSRRLLLDFTLGLGFQDGEYEEYLPADDGTGHYVWQSTHKRHWWGPTKAEVTLKWHLGKGGRR